MRKTIVLTLTAAALIAGTLAEARPGDRLRARLGGANAAAPVAQPPGKQTLSYGSDKLQNLDFYPAANGNKRAPLVVFVHGGGWKRGSKDNGSGQWKAPHYAGLGYAFVSINYRLVPDATVEQQGADVAGSLRYLIDNAARLGFDPTRIVIMGHSAGAHLVALVGTDESYLRSAGLSFSSIDGVIPIDGAAYDVAQQMQGGPGMMKETYAQAFGSDPARQRALSPTLHAASPNAPRFLIIHVGREDGVAQSIKLEAALKQGGTPVQRQQFDGRGLKGHMEINRSLGDPAYAATPVVDQWLKRVFGA
jgi:arylformamidase